MRYRTVARLKQVFVTPETDVCVMHAYAAWMTKHWTDTKIYIADSESPYTKDES